MFYYKIILSDCISLGFAYIQVAKAYVHVFLRFCLNR